MSYTASAEIDLLTIFVVLKIIISQPTLQVSGQPPQKQTSENISRKQNIFYVGNAVSTEYLKHPRKGISRIYRSVCHRLLVAAYDFFVPYIKWKSGRRFL